MSAPVKASSCIFVPADRRHPASLVPWTQHNRELVDLMRKGVTSDMICYVADQAAHVIRIEEESPAFPVVASKIPTPPQTPYRSKFQSQRETPIVSLQEFILHLVKAANIQVSTLLTTLIYLQRLRTKLPPMAKGQPLSVLLHFEP